MTVELLKPPISYKPESRPETAYQRAHEEWDRRLGASTAQAANWRYAFFACAFTAFLLAAANVYQVFARKVVPFVITLNAETGAPKVIGQAGAAEYEPQLVEIRYFLTQLIRFLRAVPQDPVVVKQNWLTAYQYLTPEAANALNARTNADTASPLKMLGERSVTVQPVSLNQIGQSSSYQLRWSEEVYDKHGVRLESYNMTGVFVVEIKPPKDEQVLSVNPLGIYVKDFQWSKEL